MRGEEGERGGGREEGQGEGGEKGTRKGRRGSGAFVLFIRYNGF